LKKVGTYLALLAFAAITSLGLVACGDDDETDGGGGGAQGGEITISQTSQPDYLDPALSYTVNGWEPMWLVYTPLLAYPHEEGEEGAVLMPGLAESMPEVTNGGRTYELTLRKGLKYSDGSPVKASDFEHTIKRVLNLESGATPFYEVIQGATKYVEAGNANGDISGIETNNRTGEITINLTEPDSSFNYVLAMNFAGLVPGDTPFENLTKDPPPGVGPYMITSSVPNREFVMEKNPNFASLGIPNIPEGNVEKITTKIIKNQGQQSQYVIDNKLDYMQDPPSADFKAEVIERFGPDGTEEQRYEEFTTLSTYYFFMNHREPPFDDPKVREAVNIGIDKPALARIFAGEATPGCTFLPPGMPGYDEALDTTDCPWGDPSQPPDIQRAKQMIREAGAAGAEVTVWGNNDDPTDKVTEAYADQLNQLGFNAEPRILDGGVYFQTIGNAQTAPQTGFANWFADFPHPLNFYFLVDGDSIQPTNNQNFGNVDDPRVNREVDALKLEQDLEAVADRWAELDRYLVESAAIVPYAHRKLATFVSERMDFQNCTLVHPLYQNDYSSFCLK
jgi:peptide/nickel transport system substrate-binding protein